jgi:hypothetical protein
MILGPSNDINAGDSSHNNQATNITNNYNSHSLTETKALFDLLFENNFLKMNAAAAVTAKELASEITEKVIERLKNEPELIEQFAKPGMQDSLFNAQKAYAISEDKDLADMLVEMIIERAKVSGKNRQQIVLDESLKVAPKLTGDQMDLLTMIHFTLRVSYIDFSSLEVLLEHYRKSYSLISSIDPTQIEDDLSLFEMLGLGKLLANGYPSIGGVFKHYYAQYFIKGFELDELNAPELSDVELYTRCHQDHTKLQFYCKDRDDLLLKLSRYNLVDERKTYIMGFYDSKIMTDIEITDYLESQVDEIKLFNKIYSTTDLKKFQISNIGIAIAMSNNQRRFGEKNDLAIWIK